MSTPCHVTLAEVQALPDSADADLIWLCMRLVAARHALDATFFGASELWADYENIDEIGSQMASLGLEVRQLSAELSKTPAQTIPGMKARGAAIRVILDACFDADDILAIRRHAGINRRSDQ